MDCVLPALPYLELSGGDDADEFIFDLEYTEHATRLPIDGRGQSLSRVLWCDLEVQDQMAVYGAKILIP
jgi:hypothetical protein